MKLEGSVDRTALALWWGSRLVVALIATAGVAAVTGRNLAESFVDRWNRWDVQLLIEIARFGYGGNPAEPPDPGLPAFFPGMPLALRLSYLLVPDWAVAGLLISLLAGTVAAVALARLGEYEGPPGTGWRATLALIAAPTAVFLFAGYSEALFLAFAVPAWLASRQGRWPLAAALATGASLVRVTGLFLAIALVVAYLTSDRAGLVQGRWRSSVWLALPFLPLVGYSAYQFGRTGDWFAWQHAQRAGWGRSLAWPWESFITTWASAFGEPTQFTWAFRFELAAAAIGISFTLWLAQQRRWSELSYVGLQVAALTASAYYLSIPRSMLLWFPLWLAIARLGVRRPWLFVCYLVLSVPLMAWGVITFVRGGWTG